GKRALPDGPKLKRVSLRCPEELPEEAQREWRRVVPELARAGLVTRVDRAALVAYCSAWARYAKAEQELAKLEDWICVTDKGYHQQTPWLGIANAALAQMKTFLTEFGMTPSSRSRVHIEKADDEEAGLEAELFGAPVKVKHG
ncbi:MAG TPA: phage terminase small subunit P27 family, partial [Anaerolineaceae bacterium]|nr:phage terminase small subunit P27 family [Anaerolineaceae bacterium]